MKKPNRISIFEIIADSSLTGAPRHLLTLLHHIDRRRFIPAVICPPGPLVDQVKKLRIPVFQVPMQGLADVNAVNAVRKIIAKYEPDIVHTHGQRGGWIGRFANYGLGPKAIHTEHTFTKELTYPNPAWHWTHMRGMSFLNIFTNHTIAVSDAVKNFLLKKRIVRPAKVSTIYNGLPTGHKPPKAEDIKRFRASYDISARDTLIGSIGSLNAQKDHTTLLRAFAGIVSKHPNTKLMLIGGGPLEAELKKLANKLAITEKVIFTGVMQDISTALHSMQLFVLPSKSEAFGISLLEAMNAKVPIIATKVGGIPEVITHNLNGLLVEQGEPKKLSAAISKLINDKKLQKKLISHYPETLRKFSAANMAKQTEALLVKLLS